MTNKTTMEKTIIERIIEVCKDDLLDNKAKEVVLTEYLKPYYRTKVLWKRVNPSQEDGEYMPEGKLVLMHNEITKETLVGRMYSSMGYCNLKGVTHWMELPESPIEKANPSTNIDPCPFTDTELIGLEEKPNHSAIWVNPYTVNNV